MVGDMLLLLFLSQYLSPKINVHWLDGIDPQHASWHVDAYSNVLVQVRARTIPHPVVYFVLPFTIYHLQCWHSSRYMFWQVWFYWLMVFHLLQQQRQCSQRGSRYMKHHQLIHLCFFTCPALPQKPAPVLAHALVALPFHVPWFSCSAL